MDMMELEIEVSESRANNGILEILSDIYHQTLDTWVITTPAGRYFILPASKCRLEGNVLTIQTGFAKETIDFDTVTEYTVERYRDVAERLMEDCND